MRLQTKELTVIHSIIILIIIFLTILFHTTKVTAETTFRATVSVSQGQISSCGIIGSDSDLTQQLNAAGDCININNNNIYLNCSSFMLVGNGSRTAINISNQNNITIHDCVIENFTNGFAITNTTNIVIQNITTVNITNLVTGGGIITLRNVSLINNSQLIVSEMKLNIIDSFIGATTFTNSNLSLIRQNSGELNFSTQLNGGSTLNLTDLIVIKNESIKIKSTFATFLNLPARLTFFPQNFTNIEAKNDPEDDETYVTCTSNICQNITINPDTFIYDVSHFTTYYYGASEPTVNPAHGGTSVGGGSAAKVIDLEISPEIIDTKITEGEKRQFIIEVKTNSMKRDLDIFLNGPDFMSLNDHKRQYSLSLPQGEVWYVMLIVEMPKDAQGVYNGEIVIKGVNVEKTVPISITAIVPIKETPASIEKPTIEVQTEKQEQTKKHSRMKKAISYLPFMKYELLEEYSNTLRIWIILFGIIMIISIIIIVLLSYPLVIHKIKTTVIDSIKYLKSLTHKRTQHNTTHHPHHTHHTHKK